ncbi:leucyl/phenylalanyl-tRNA--protein transferase [Methylomarinum sp. Ch1-1]|uniref:Leucyl/phenylalanyl-tRNA--protein transferase n=1 Tax=Methylomarinum roseum TaxID=3067653 RepID=A0AAU7NQ39_9GAMM|nr:leucyl/phenylalanyl-tRNA--protein transferase [Methylomarinum sp. Ch1-1]MDP4520987.1 leucyl/phenylalanyl-tRNA--protein transferase [Methylomarinum sp. Ch1-1]
MKLTVLDPFSPDQPFPDPENALQEPDGLLAIGGCLSPERIINAYRHGIFPWYGPDEPILWWSPNPRLVLFPEQLKISRSLRKTIRKEVFQLSYDQAFAEVIEACAAPRQKQDGTWITEEMNEAYTQLHRQGIAHSVEAWHDGNLVGGLYGLAIGQVFFGESMFHRKTDASKVVFAYLVKHLIDWRYQLIDCQVHSPHLASLGAVEIERRDFIGRLRTLCNQAPGKQAWQSL